VLFAQSRKNLKISAKSTVKLSSLSALYGEGTASDELYRAAKTLADREGVISVAIIRLTAWRCPPDSRSIRSPSPRLEARGYRAEVHEQGRSGRAVDDVDRPVGGAGFGRGDGVGVDVEW
jgi:hypothetical protein